MTITQFNNLKDGDKVIFNSRDFTPGAGDNQILTAHDIENNYFFDHSRSVHLWASNDLYYIALSKYNCYLYNPISESEEKLKHEQEMDWLANDKIAEQEII